MKIQKGFELGAKWQMERSYSEEELKLPSKWKKWYKNNWNTSIEMEKQQSYSEEEVKIILFARDTHHQLTKDIVDIDNWFKQFKNK